MAGQPESLKNITLNDSTVLQAQYNPERRKYEVICPRCGTIVTLTKHGSPTPINEHVNSRRCNQLARAQAQNREREAATVAQTRYFPSASAHPFEISVDEPSGLREVSSMDSPDQVTVIPVSGYSNTHPLSQEPTLLSSHSGELQQLTADPVDGSITTPLPSFVFEEDTSPPPALHEATQLSNTALCQPEGVVIDSTMPSTLLSHQLPQLPHFLSPFSSRAPSPSPSRVPSPSPSLSFFPSPSPSPSQSLSTLPSRVLSPLPSRAASPLPPNLLEPSISLPSTSHVPRPRENIHPCSGVAVKWEAGSIWDSYPFHQHKTHDYPWEPIGITNDEWLYLRSDSCKQHTQNASHVCEECEAIPNDKRYRKAVARASSNLSESMPWGYLTRRQLVAHSRLLVKKYLQLKQEVRI